MKMALLERASTLLNLTEHEARALFILTAGLQVSEPEQAALRLIDAIIAREKHDVTDDQRTRLEHYGIPTEATS